MRASADLPPHQLASEMTASVPRVAYFPDSFHEVNGVAHTSRHFEDFARRRNLPFLCVRAGDRAQALIEEGSVWTLELPRGFLSFALEKDLRLDPAFLRHIPLIGEVLERFKPDLIHITGPSEIGVLGAGLAHHFICRWPRAGIPMFTNTPRAARSGCCGCCPGNNPLSPAKRSKTWHCRQRRVSTPWRRCCSRPIPSFAPCLSATPGGPAT